MPNDADAKALLAQARTAWAAGALHEALQLCDRAALTPGDARYRAAILRGDILLEMGDAAGALSSYETVADPSVPDPELDCLRGVALFELLRFAEAENALQSAIRGRPNLARAYFVLGLMAEITGSGQDTEYFRRARKIDGEAFAPGVRLALADFEAAVEEAMGSAPEPFKKALRDVPVLVAQLPRLDDLRRELPAVSPKAFGTRVRFAPGRSPHDYDGPIHTGVLLFKRNIERGCKDREALIERIRDTILEEVKDSVEVPGEKIGLPPERKL